MVESLNIYVLEYRNITYRDIDRDGEIFWVDIFIISKIISEGRNSKWILSIFKF